MATKRDVRLAWEDGYDAGLVAASLLRDKGDGEFIEQATSVRFKQLVRLMRSVGFSTERLAVPTPRAKS